MSAGDVTTPALHMDDLRKALSRVNWPLARLSVELPVQDAAQKAIDALDQLSIECEIVTAREKSRISRDTAARQDNYVAELIALRNPR